MNTMSSPGFNRLERRFIQEPGHHAPAGAFGRRTFGRAAPSPAGELEVERILARCRARRLAEEKREERSRPRRGEETLAYLATGLSLVALSAISVLPIF
ncbi:hypothetical protein [Parvibaculum sp.]|jgi:hypothetical protein|uniref:hypothetical protein n=1 Tax=Parvibaculum sp. TaxID=2024848 RepID=UPI001B214C82|nr:hypothetical protein [Parvibaculum sp.]MBO6633317.1 hypothetical protein [Parvibaculum sp.]MBO6678155.1 hypothetical protein [Parvibaculum sp.]MBO6683697.1 hypothetical protein [Parvibaculum sp.]MBO6906459.1 hypothetical protein [Parvibaculum sp.]